MQMFKHLFERLRQFIRKYTENERLLLSATSFTAKCELVFVLTQKNP